jgi:hypothetical protein
MNNLIALAGYDKILLSPEFYKHFKSQHVLTFQTDTVLRRAIDEDMYQYDYVGAPWDKNIIDLHMPNRPNVGNGGLALRKVSAMLDIAENTDPEKIDEAEDIYISRRVKTENMPNEEVAMRFSVESIPYDDPCGFHALYRQFDAFELIRLMTGIPGMP